MVIPQLAKYRHCCEACSLDPVQQELSLFLSLPLHSIMPSHHHSCKLKASTQAAHFLCHKFVKRHPWGSTTDLPIGHHLHWQKQMPGSLRRAALNQYKQDVPWSRDLLTKPVYSELYEQKVLAAYVTKVMAAFTAAQTEPHESTRTLTPSSQNTAPCLKCSLFYDTVQWLILY